MNRGFNQVEPGGTVRKVSPSGTEVFYVVTGFRRKVTSERVLVTVFLKVRNTERSKARRT